MVINSTNINKKNNSLSFQLNSLNPKKNTTYLQISLVISTFHNSFLPYKNGEYQTKGSSNIALFFKCCFCLSFYIKPFTSSHTI